VTVARYESYQASGVEWLADVPSHWELKRLAHFFDERREKCSDTDYPALSVTKNGIVPQLETAAKTDDGDNRKKVLEGDFVINSRSDRKGSSGLSQLNGSVSLINTVLKPMSGMVGTFAHHLLRSAAFQEEYYRYGKGIVADLWSTNFSEMRNIVLAIPPHSEQASIAAFLDWETGKIDALVEAQRRLIELLKEKRQAVISDAVTKGLDPTTPMKDSGVEWLGEVPTGWSVCPLGYRYEVALGKMLDEARMVGDRLAPYLRNIDVQWDRINIEGLPEMDFAASETDRYGLRAGDLLVCEGGEIGRAAIWAAEIEGCYYQKALHRLRPRNPLADVPRFLFHVLRAATSRDVFSAGTGRTTIAHLPAETFRRYRFPFPPPSEQVAIAAFLDWETAKIDALVSRAEAAMELLRERRAALISAAVTGKIDVRGLSDRETEAA
jgi:type I restriction enzyme S subunit